MSKRELDAKTSFRVVAYDLELERGTFPPGRYYIKTPTFHYLGTLEYVAMNVYVFRDVSTVFDSGPYDALRAGKPKNAQFLTERMIFDRAGTNLAQMP